MSDNNIGGYYDRDGFNPTPEGPKAISEAIRVTTSVTCLDVRRNGISGDGASQLSAAVLGNQKMEVFNEIPIKEMRADTLAELDLGNKDVGVVGSMVLAGLLSSMTSLTQVIVCVSNRSETAMSYMVHVLLQIDLSGNQIGGYRDGPWPLSPIVSTPEGPKAIADAIRVSTSVTSVSATTQTQLELVSWWDSC